MKRLWSVLVIGLMVQGVSAQTSPHGAIKLACESCHTTDSWKMKKDPSFQHAKTGFALEGQHAGVACISCHKGLKFTDSSHQCTACHTDVHKSELGSNCTRCHSMQSWSISDMIQRHQTTRFPLLGRHATLQCENCHSNVAQHKYTGAAITCYGCHSTDYQNTKNPGHSFAGFSTDCEKCHKVNSFSWGNGFDHNATAFPLTGMHVTTPCSACHQNGSFKNTAQDCYACHQTTYRATTSPNHIAAKFETNCVTCHTTAGWSPASFSHDNTKFPLTGAHKSVLCKDCHVNNQFATLPMNCVDCHRADFVGTTNPNHQTQGYPQNCVQCHSTSAWKPASFDHNTTKFALTGRHINIQCQDCHTNNNYRLVYTNCYPCHQVEYQRPTNPNHVVAMLDHRCESCHSTNTWVPSTFSHSSTKFVLTGKHATTECQSCHVNGNYQLAFADCYQCHLADYAKVTNPVHVVPSFSHQCETCHTTSVWAPSTFDHNATKFALTGAHRTVLCKTCHVNNQYSGLAPNCIDCHRTDYATTTNPNHQALGYPQVCTQCHTTAAWKPATFDHNATKFALTGAHIAVQCAQCHVNNNYQLAYTDCYPCHSADFARPANPNHVTGMLDHRCETCHSTTAWIPSTFNHGSTKFALTGTHATTPCQSCHVNGNYKLSYTGCYSCHSADFAMPKNPNHVTASFSHACEMCHTTTVWKPSTFNHGSTTFALTGTHATTPCESCHTNGNYQLAYSGCYSCHATDFAKPTNPNHVTAAFNHACETCHTTNVWKPATFNHSSTKFALTGTHATTPCESCHTNGNYQLTYTDCYSCHAADFAKPTNPNHVTAAFSHACETCHTTIVWKPSTFSHSTTKFPLTGTHVTTPCQSCHINGNYKLAYSDCYSCHATDFAVPTNPNHVTASFSHVCETCHTTTVWKPSTFSHSSTKLPLTGAHVTTPCQSCHTNGNYKLAYTDCYACHAAEFAKPTNPNHLTANFSHACETCHTTTVWKPSTFSHSATKFPLTGTHIATACQACHTNGNYQLVYTDCYPCHTTDFARPVNPNHVTGMLDHRCETCHSTTAWLPSTFNHGSTRFALTGTHVTTPCQSCHVNGNYKLVYTDCYSCHAADFAKPANPNHVAANFSHACETCHTTTVWKPSTFNHSTTKFALTGTHAATPCQSCHVNGNYQLAYTNCYQCHAADFAGATNPNHAAGNFSQNCQTCHNTTAWQPATFDHNTTKLPLTGAHVAVACQTCHTNGNYQLVYSTCYQCHASDFTGATNPNHVAGNFSQSCQTCHTTTAWRPATFNHSTTKFALTGAHLAVPCQTCHTGGNYQLVYTNCYQCHGTDFTGATNPNHVSGGFSQTCQTCHTTTAWQPASFDHTTTKFPLTGTHTTTPCASCHVSGNYKLVYTDCYQCHSADFAVPTNPNHVLPGFSHQCQLCHTTTVWKPSTFNHDGSYFKIYSGKHKGRWTLCNQCHANPASYTDFTCITCHEHAKSQVDSNHGSVKGYIYSATSCYTCHRTV
jgi:hypothetical protein